MTTGAFWDVSNPLKPLGAFDPNSILDIPFDWAAWLLDIGATYDSHLIVVADPLECPSSAESSGVVIARIQVKAGETAVVGTKYPVTCRITASDGQVEDQTVWLKIREK